MKRRLFALLLALALVVSCLPHVVLAEGTQTEEQQENIVEETTQEAVVTPEAHSHSDAHICEDCEDGALKWTAWEKTNALPTTTGHYYLTGDVYLPDHFNVSASNQVVLCLNGYTVDAQQNSCIYRISGSAKVTIADCTAHTDAEGNYVAGALANGKEGDRGALVFALEKATFQMFGGKLINGTNTQSSSSMGWGGTVHARGNAHIYLKDCEVSGNHTTAEGGVICLRETGATGDTAATAYCENVTFKGNYADRKGGVIFLNNAKNSITVKNCTFEGNYSKGSAGVIYSNYGTVTVENCTFKGNYCSNSGGDIQMNGGSLTVSGSTFDGTNTAGKVNAANGGAIYLGAGATATIKSGRFSGYQAGNYGGVVFAKESKTLLLVEDGEFIGNVAKNGAVVAVENGGTAKITGGTFQDNKASGKGGALWVNGKGATGIVAGGTFAGNAAANGGAVYQEGNGCTLDIRSGKITGNTATNLGGGVYANAGATLKLSGDPEITTNTANGTINNLYLAGQQVITLGTMKEGTGKVGISADATALPRTVSTDVGAVDCSAYFVSDSPYRAVSLQENKLYIDYATDHQHCDCANIGGDHCDHTQNVWVAWEKTDSLPTTSGYYYLVADVTTKGRQSVQSGNDVHLCMNGHTVDGSEKMIYHTKTADAKLTITDCTAHTDDEGNYVAGAFTNSQDVNVGAIYAENGSVTMFGIKLTDNYNTQTSTAAGWAGGAIHARNDAKLLLVGVELSDNHSTAEGGAICLRGKAQAVLENCTFRNNTADRKGGAIWLNDKTNALTVKNCIFDGNNTVVDAGGAIMSNGAPVTVTGSTFTNNTAGGNGGAIMMYGGTLSVEGSTFTGNTGKEGGAMRFTGGCEVQITSSEFTANHATVSAGAISSADTNLTLENNKINENTSGGTAGALFFAGTDRVLTLVSGEFVGNTAAAAGGAMLVQSRAKLVMKDGTFTGNTSTGGDGGAFYISTNCSGVMENGTITGNTAKGYGGGIMLFGSSLTMNNGTISGNKADNGAGVTGRPGIRTVDGQQIRDVAVTFTMNDGTISENEAPVSGGGVLINGKGSAFAMNGGTVANNKSENGGGIIGMSEAVIQLTNGTVTGNEVPRNGGGIYVSYTASLVQDGGEISSNRAGNNGGGVYVYGGSFTLNEGKLTGNYAKNYGGAIRTDGTTQKEVEYTGQLTIKGGTISGNTAGHSGAGVAARNTQFLLEDCKITGNYSDQSAGGILLLAGADLKMTGGSITGNNTGVHAGGIFCSNDSKITMTGGSVSYNTCQKNGGGVFLMAAKGYFYGGSISGNDAGASAGGLNVSGSEVVLGGVYITNNHSKTNAGGVSSVRYNKTMPKLTITGGVISGNKTDGQGGGMVVMSAGQTWMKGGIIEKNESAGNGGGIYVSTNHTFEMSGGEIRNNKSGNQGAGVYHLASVGNYTGGKITGNEATKNGGGMVMTGASNVTMKDFEITENSGWTGGAFVINNQNVKFTAENCDFSRNKAVEAHAGAFYVVWGVTDTLLKNCTIADNYAKQDGGAIYQINGNLLTLMDCTITGNSAGRQGGAIWTRSPSHLTNCVISNNTAGAEGGGICTGGMGTSNIRLPAMKIDGCTMENNVAGTQGGGMYLASGSWVKANNMTLKGNTSKAEGSAIWAVDDTTLTNVTITGNTSENGGYALYYGAAEPDGLSYFRGMHKIDGQVIVDGNQGGDLFLGEQTTLSIGAAGLTGDSKLNVKLHSGLLTQHLYGAYDYEGGNCEYVVTVGQRSQTEPEFDASMLPQEEEPTEAPTDGEDTGDGEKTAVNPVIWIVSGAGVAVIAAIAIIIAALSKKKKAAAKK